MLMLSEHVVVCEAKRGTAVDLIAPDNLKDCEDEQRCDHSGRRCEGEHHEGRHIKAIRPVACMPAQNLSCLKCTLHDVVQQKADGMMTLLMLLSIFDNYDTKVNDNAPRFRRLQTMK